MKRRCIMLCFLWILLCPLVSWAHSTEQNWQARQYEAMTPQTAEWDCGPAAVGTILQLLQWPQIAPAAIEPPVNMADLQDQLASVGLPAEGFRLHPDQLWNYLEQGTPVPLLIHVQWPEPHFSVLAGSWQQWLLLADPGIGWRWLDWETFNQLWTGYVLLPQPTAVAPPAAVIAERQQQLQNLLRLKQQF